MREPGRSLLESAREFIAERSFVPSTGDLVGAELEWFTSPSADPPDIPTLEGLLRDVPLAGGSALTFEPGGQVELSSRTATDVGTVCDALARDGDTIRDALAAAGIDTFAGGIDAARSTDLKTDATRYVAMRHYFDAYGISGGRMMCTTASIHTNVDAGHDAEGRARWVAAHTAGPMLVAAFANSPHDDGYKSSRMNAWMHLDPSRVHPASIDGDPVDAWTDYVLASRVMFIRQDGRYVPLDEHLTLADWIVHGHSLGSPTTDDIAYHMTTLFPPVRAHGWLELRMVDMLPAPWWRAAIALSVAVVCDPATRDATMHACEGLGSRWDLAAKCALEDPPLHGAAVTSFTAALDALERIGCDAETVNVTNRYVERFTVPGRTPADDIIDGHTTLEAV